MKDPFYRGINNENLNFKLVNFEQAMNIKKSDSTAIVLDVRTPEEFNEGHLHDAVLIPYDEIEKYAPNALPDKTVPILIYCRAGRRSLIAANTLINLGYSNIYEFGGHTLW